MQERRGPAGAEGGLGGAAAEHGKVGPLALLEQDDENQEHGNRHMDGVQHEDQVNLPFSGIRNASAAPFVRAVSRRRNPQKDE